MHGLRTAGRARASFAEHLYGTLHAAGIYVGMSPDCRKLGLGVRDISIAAGTGTDVMARGAGAAGSPELYLYMSLNTYKTWDIPA